MTLTVIPPDDSQFQEMGKQLTAQWGKASSAMREVVLLGTMLWQVYMQVEVVRVRTTSGSRGPIKGGGMTLNEWLGKYAPSVPRQRASEFLTIARGLGKAFQIASPEHLQKLLGTPTGELEPRSRKKQAQLWKAVDGTSRRQLLFNFGGVVVDDPKGKGGKRDKKKLTLEEQDVLLQEMAEAWWWDFRVQMHEARNDATRDRLLRLPLHGNINDDKTGLLDLSTELTLLKGLVDDVVKEKKQRQQ